MKRTTMKERNAMMTSCARKAVSAFTALALSVSMFGIPAFADELDAGDPVQEEQAQDGAQPVPGEDAPSADGAGDAPSEEGATNDEGTQEGTSSEEQASDDGSAPADDADGSTEGDGSGSTKLPSESDGGGEGAVAKSIIHVDITDAKPFDTGEPPQFDISLSGRGFQYIKPAAAGAGYRGSYTYVNVEPGDYELAIEADGYATYAQAIHVDADVPRAYTVKLNTFDRAESSTQTGIIYYGDVTGDSAINDDDVDALIGALESGADAAANPRCDLTGADGITLADLQVLAEGYGRDQVSSNVTPKPRVTGVTVSDNITIPADSQIVDVSEVVGNPDENASLKMVTTNDQPISVDNPATIVLDNLHDQLNGEQVGCITIKPPLSRTDDGISQLHPHAVTEGTVEVTYLDEAGNEQTLDAEFAPTGIASALVQMAAFLGLAPEKAYAASAKATIDGSGNIIIDFGSKIAIKKVTIKVTKTNASDGKLNLAEISSVEFLNGTEDLIAPPELNIPTNVTATPGSKEFTVSWNAEPNVTGYEVSVSENGKEQIMSTKNTTMQVTSFKHGNKGKVENNHTYTVKVQSTNGEWRSGWSNAVTVTPKATKRPDRPESVKVSGGYKMINVGWKAMTDTDTYIGSYRKEGDATWTEKSGITSSSCQISGLEDRTTYEVFVSGVNEIGKSDPSQIVSAETTTIAPAELPNYKLVNKKDANGRYLTGITTARVISASMVDSAIDGNAGTALGLFDDDYTSYAKKEDWDFGSAYNAGKHGVEVTFDGVKEIGFISYAASSQNIDYSGVRVHASTGGSAWQPVSGVSFTQQKCANGRTYTLVKIDGGLRADKVLIGMERHVRLIDIAEMRFHGYDSIEDDVNALYADEMHIKLADGVDEARISALETRLNTADADGNYYPFKTVVQMDIDFARQLLADEKAGLSELIRVHTDISSAADSGKNLGMGGLNSWQPLGKVAAAGDQLVLYASKRNSRTNSSVQIYIGQQYPESSDAPSYGGTFQANKRIVYSVPEKIQVKGKEHGGPLYAQYVGNDPNEEWYIRVMGGHDIATLDLHNVTDHETRVQKAEQYITELDESLSLLNASKGSEDAHRAAHLAESKLVVDKVEQDTINPSVDCDYNERHCIHNATELMTDTMLYSVPATQAARSCTGSTLRERAESLITHMDGSEQMLKLFYQHKGLMEPGEGVAKTNELSSQHLNIRLMQMFAGAFMYAAGNHIGVDFPESGNFAILRPISDAATAPGGTKQSGDGFYFGWGSAHEIGHNINNGRYALAEVTNNYFAQICKMVNEGTTRFSYDSVYERVTSGAVGRTGGVATQLAMYWQLMLAHDANEVYTLYSSYDQLKANRFFARVDGYARNPGSAPAPGKVELVCNAGESQNIIRLASAAAEKDLSDFFISWGLVPNADTERYVSQFPKEERALQYVNDDAVKWIRANPSAAQVKGVDMTAVSLSQSNSKVTLDMSTKDAAYNASLIGYELTRVYYASGKPQKEVVGFVRADENGGGTFVDDAAHLGNRAVHYEVKAVDKFLNYSAAAVTEQKKLDGNGRFAPTEWSVDTNMVVAEGTQEQVSKEAEVAEPECPSEMEGNAPKPIESVLAGEKDYLGYTVASGSTPAADPYVLIDMRKTNPVVSVRYTPGDGAALSDYVIETSVNGINFTTVAEGTFDIGSEGYADVFFTGKNEQGSPNNWICSETARYVRITAPGKAGAEVSIKAIDIFGPSGDNIDFTSVQGQEDIKAIGTLSADFQLDADDPNQKIPAGSIIFTGAVKGNPAYNVVVLYDADGTIVGGSTIVDGEEILNAEQVLLADVPEGSLIGDTADGRWVYWIAPDADLPAKVRAELYRVNDAFTNEGQRLVADTMFIDVPAKADLPSITLKSDSQGQ